MFKSFTGRNTDKSANTIKTPVVAKTVIKNLPAGFSLLCVLEKVQ